MKRRTVKKDFNDFLCMKLGILKAKVESLTPLLFEYTGKDLYELRRKLVIYEDMAYDCKASAIAFSDEQNERIKSTDGN